MSPASARAERIAAQIQRLLAGLLLRGVKDPRVGNVSVTAVRLDPDLRAAHVYVLPFGAGADAGSGTVAGTGAATGTRAAAGTAAGAGTRAAPNDTAAMLAGLHSAAGFLRGQIARELQLRYAPRLFFELDAQLERAHHLTELIDRAVTEDESSQGRRQDPDRPDKV